MGTFKNFISKAKGVFGRVVDGVAKYAPKIGGVLNRVGDMTGIPLLGWAGKIANGVGGIAGAFKNKDYNTAIGKVKDTITNTTKPDVNKSIEAGKDFIKGEIGKLKHKITT